jgi:phage gpG-like protein
MAFIPQMKVMGIDRAKGMLLGAMGAVGHMAPAMEIVADDMMRVVGINFSSQGRRGGGSWKQDDPAWVARKIEYGASPLILQMWGYLYRSMTVRGEADQRLVVTDEGVELASELPYANVQDKGGGPNNIWARPFATFIDTDLVRWTEICEQYIMDAMRAGAAE